MPRIPSRSKISSCHRLGHKVFESTPILIPSTLSRLNSGSTSSSVRVACSQNARYPLRCDSSKSTPARSQISAIVADRCSSRDRFQTIAAASSRAVVASSTRSGAARRATDAHSSLASMLLHGVRVPPQSKMTASMELATYDTDQVLDDLLHRDVRTGAARPVLHLDDTVGEASADDHDRRHPEQLSVLELHPR